MHFKPAGVGARPASRQQGLASGDRECQHHDLGCRLPEPVTNLIVKCLDLAGFHEVSVVSKSVEELRSVRLRIDWLEDICLIESIGAGDVDVGMHVVAHSPPPTGDMTKRAQVRQRVYL